MASTSKLTNLSLHGKGLKLDTRADIEPYLKDVDPSIIEEIHLGGNTIGVDASLALAEFLQKTQVLKARVFLFVSQKSNPLNVRSPILLISSPVG